MLLLEINFILSYLSVFTYYTLCTHTYNRNYTHTPCNDHNNNTRAVLRLVWPSILLQSARDRVATAAETVTAVTGQE